MHLQDVLFSDFFWGGVGGSNNLIELMVLLWCFCHLRADLDFCYQNEKNGTLLFSVLTNNEHQKTNNNFQH